jgi:hypothetical protein
MADILTIGREPVQPNGRFFINFREKAPQLTFNTDCKSMIKRWNKDYLKVKINKDERIIEFYITDEKDGFRVYSLSQWVTGVFTYGINSARIRDEFSVLGIEFTRLFVTCDEENQRFIYRY